MIGLRLFPLKSAGVRGAGKRDESLRTSAWEANFFSDFEKKKPIVLQSKQCKGIKVFFSLSGDNLSLWPPTVVTIGQTKFESGAILDEEVAFSIAYYRITKELILKENLLLSLTRGNS